WPTSTSATSTSLRTRNEIATDGHRSTQMKKGNELAHASAYCDPVFFLSVLICVHLWPILLPHAYTLARTGSADEALADAARTACQRDQLHACCPAGP